MGRRLNASSLKAEAVRDSGRGGAGLGSSGQGSACFCQQDLGFMETKPRGGGGMKARTSL